LNAGELEIGGLQQAPDAVDDAIAVLLQMDAAAFQPSCFANGNGRNEASRQPSMLQKFGDPAAINPIGLVPGQSAYLGRIDERQLELIAAGLQRIPDRNPIHTRRFHCHMPDPIVFQPSAQPLQIPTEGGEGLALFFVLAVAYPNSDAGGNGVVMTVQSGATAI
jgi:hypothetical protein